MNDIDVCEIKRLAQWAETVETESKLLQQELRAIEERLKTHRRTTL
jgi:hypothetical protein